MRFQNVVLLNLAFFLVIPLAVLIYYRIIKRQDKLKKMIGDERLINELISSLNIKLKKRKIQLVLLSVFFIFLSLSRPQYGSVSVEAKRKGVDVVIVIDTSISMLAEDVSPNRLEKAKQEIVKVINNLKGDRIGIVSFAGTAFTLCPLTLDKSAARMFLSILDNDLMPVQGTAIARAIDVARGAFSKKERKYKVMILITDGEDHSGNVLASAKQAKEEGIIIFTIGIGDSAGNPIPLKDAQGKSVGFKKDMDGNVVVSKLDETILKEIAQETGGQYAKVSSGDWGLYRIYDKIKSMDKKELKSKMVTVYEEKFQFFL
ncbi:VWA domain-containing protein, partial [bacterium]|nr:VWA domain-containing protein [bacterium]